MNSESLHIFEFFKLKPVWRFSTVSQILTITSLYVLMIFGYFISVGLTGKMDGYPVSTSLLFVPFYEEFIFRGFLLRFFESQYGSLKAILFSSMLFMIWHLKNIFWLDEQALIQQILWTGVFVGPLLGWITLKLRTLWPAVILHFLINMPYQPLFELIFNSF